MLPIDAAPAQLLRTALLAGWVLVLGIAALDWAVRTRRISPFNGISRFMRARVDPMLAGIERLVVRAGGHQSATPWWGAFAYVVAALALMAAVDFAVEAVHDVVLAANGGALGIMLLAVHWTFGFFILALLVRVFASWVPPLARSRWLWWSHGATEWMLRPLRQVLPTIGPIDISPIVAYFALRLIRYLVERVLFGIQ
jgi:YggT family protein